jgi:hypothetical protein
VGDRNYRKKGKGLGHLPFLLTFEGIEGNIYIYFISVKKG